VLSINQALQQRTFRLIAHKRSATFFTSLCPLSAILTSKGDSNDTSCICWWAFQPFAKKRLLQHQDYVSKVQPFRPCGSMTMPCRFASLKNVLQICSRQVHVFSVLPSTIKDIKALRCACTCLYLHTGVHIGDGTSSRIVPQVQPRKKWWCASLKA